MQVTRQNLIASESSIRDTDYLGQFTNFVKETIQAKASLALLAHSRVNANILLDFLKA
jgi:flagellin-like hook-associated protein FlgL